MLTYKILPVTVVNYQNKFFGCKSLQKLNLIFIKISLQNGYVRHQYFTPLEDFFLFLKIYNIFLIYSPSEEHDRYISAKSIYCRVINKYES